MIENSTFGNHSALVNAFPQSIILDKSGNTLNNSQLFNGSITALFTFSDVAEVASIVFSNVTIYESDFGQNYAGSYNGAIMFYESTNPAIQSFIVDSSLFINL